MDPLLNRIAAGDVLLCDGAIGTMLFEMGLEPGSCPDAIALSRPALLQDIAKRYLDAGADIVETNTFGASPMKLAQYQLEQRTEEINCKAVEAVRAAVGDRAYVGGCCGPTGHILEPYGDASPDEVLKSYRRQVRSLVDAGVDCVVIETMTDLVEATLAIRAAKEVSPATPVTATMTFDDTPRGFYSIMGVRIEDAASRLAAAGAEVVGSNCGNGVENMVKIARAFREHTDLPIIIQSNAGLPETVDGKTVYRETPDFMAGKVRDLVDIGVSIIGGCCGTTPDHIREFRAAIDALAQ